jgi:type I restriction enzyme R subunit
MNKVRDKEDTDIPEKVKNNQNARAYYGIVYESLQEIMDDCIELSAEAGLEIDNIINEHKVVNWVSNPDIQKKMEQDIDDYFFDLIDRHGIKLDLNRLDKLIENIIQTAIHRSLKR